MTVGSVHHHRSHRLFNVVETCLFLSGRRSAHMLGELDLVSVMMMTEASQHAQSVEDAKFAEEWSLGSGRCGQLEIPNSKRLHFLS